VLRLAPFIIEIGLLIYGLIDAIQTPDAEVRNLPKIVWILLILFIPVIGPIVWLVAGRPQNGSARQVPWPASRTAGFPEYERPRPLGPDDDPDFLREMKRGNDEQEQLLNRWEEDLRRREQQLKPPSDDPTDKPRDDGPDGAPSPKA
jgi:Phospholipase_D-nuclease N-terminal